MKCNNCGFNNVNGANFCENCGNKLQSNLESNIEKLPLELPKDEKKSKKLFIILGVIAFIVLVVLIVIIITNRSNKFVDPFEDIDDLTFVNTTSSTREPQDVNLFTKKIEDDYKSGILSKDDYIMQLAYSIYDTSKIDYKYKNLTLDFYEPKELFNKVSSMYNELSNDTLVYVFKKYTLSDVKWNVEEDAKVEGTANGLTSGIDDYQVMPLVNKDSNVGKLDEVKLSDNSHFLIYYTKDGTNAITDDTANKIASHLESTVSAYKSEFNLDYQYEGHYNFGSSLSLFQECPVGTAKGKACKLLKNNNIDTRYLDTAMPVYIINLDNTNALGYYLYSIDKSEEIALKINDIFEDMGTTLDIMATTYSFPYFVISSTLDDFDDFKIVSSHELFHHYQTSICDSNKCPSGNFTVETTANLAAVKVSGVNKMGTALSNHATMYINDIETSIDKVGDKGDGYGLGYGAFVFATNYSDTVNNGVTHLVNSLKTTDTLKYLYDNSGGKYKDSMLKTAEENLTLDNSNKLLIASQNGNIIYPANHKDIGKVNTIHSNTINYSSMHYYYIDPQNYTNKSQLSFNTSSNDLSVLLFIKENNEYKYLYTHTLDKDFVINIDDFGDYQEVAFAIVNTSINGTLTYNYELDNNGTKTPTVTAKSLKLESMEEKINKYSTFTCHQIEDDSEYQTVTQIKLSFDKKDKISDMYFKGTMQIKNNDSDDPAFAITQRIVSGLLYIMKNKYKKQFKYCEIITQEEKDKYSVTFKITKNYYDVLNNSLKLNSETKYNIIKSIQTEGYTCQYQK